MRASRGFTFVELMISMALMAVTASVSVMAFSHYFSFVSGESEYRIAERNARYTIETLRHTSCSQLPPQSVQVGAGGWVQLGQTDLVPGSVTPRPKQVDDEHGRVQLDAPEGSVLTVNYRFYACDQAEAHTATPAPATVPGRKFEEPDRPNPDLPRWPVQVALARSPVCRLKAVRVLKGETSIPLPPQRYKLDRRSGLLHLPAEAAGRVIEVDYFTDRISNEVSGEALDSALQPTREPGAARLMRVSETYGRFLKRSRRFELTLLKPGP